MAGGGCGVGLGLGWGFGSAYGTRYLDSKLKFQGTDFGKVETAAASQQPLNSPQKDSWILSRSWIDVVFKILLVAKPKCNLYILLEGLEVAKVINCFVVLSSFCRETVCVAKCSFLDSGKPCWEHWDLRLMTLLYLQCSLLPEPFASWICDMTLDKIQNW